MTDPRDDFYQPWVREPAAPAPPVAKRRYEPVAAETGLGRDEAVPLGIDLSRYVLDEAAPLPVADRVKPIARAAGDGAGRLWTASQRGGAIFADWTIALGARADIPARVAALEIPRRCAVGARLAGSVLATAGRATAVATRRAARAAQRRAGAAAVRAGTEIRRIAARGAAAGGHRFAALRPVAAPTAVPPRSGLDRLLESDVMVPATKPTDASNLPLFSAAPVSLATPITVSSPPADLPAVPVIHPSADERPSRPASPTNAGAGPGGGAGGAGVAYGSLPHWLPWGAAGMLLLVLVFWLGSRWGSGAMDRTEMAVLVKEVILANPEIVPQALEKHQANQMATAIDAVRPLLEKPFAGAWAGNAKGDVTVTVFTDYGCVYCRASLADVDRLVRADKGVKLVYRELPIIAPQSKDAALAALAAARQGKYDAFHHAMFAAPGLDRAAIDAASTRAGVILDDRSDAGVDTRLFEREIDNNLALAQQIGVNATPTWIIGSKMLQGAVGFDELQQAVAAARAAN